MPTRSVLRHTGQGKAIVEQCPIPLPASGEARIKVEAVALNPIDWKMLYRQVLPDPTILGCDFVGIVECLGEHVDRIKVGDRVACMTQGGKSA